MKIFFLLKLINSSEINSTIQTEINPMEKVRFHQLVLFGHYILYKEFEDKNYEHYINLPIDNKNLDSSFMQKCFLIFNNATSKMGYFEKYIDFTSKIITNQQGIIDYFLSRDTKNKFDKIKSNIEEKYDFFSLENFKNMFSYSYYLKTIEESEFKKLINSPKEYEYNDFVNMLNLKNIEIKEYLLEDLNSGSIKEIEKNLDFHSEALQIAKNQLKNIVLEYEERNMLINPTKAEQEFLVYCDCSGQSCACPSEEECSACECGSCVCNSDDCSYGKMFCSCNKILESSEVVESTDNDDSDFPLWKRATYKILRFNFASKAGIIILLSRIAITTLLLIITTYE